MIQLYHCARARSFRPLWMLEEMGLPYQLHLLPFPPRALRKDYLGINPLGTVPYMVDGAVRMSESTGICHYLAETHGPTDLRIAPGEPDYASYVNWLFFSDATLTFPQAIVLRYGQFEAPERKSAQVTEDYAQFFRGRMRTVTAALAERDFLCGGRFTTADVAIGYALHLAEVWSGLSGDFAPEVAAYLERLRARPAFQRAIAAETKS
ncbi:glutathione S-transferase family protein [Sphingosinicella rhizophila]|uniref:Glutathione S-transferase family protein n=1 Tax=Sphingosinicella rhizophila TaxID=3050082 RepID=A0ABU3Q1R5_9SPHN|nr:glutathione S-transferase family protein [Sphingosinicella sp. GR2756]MDT9597338.1 glutathione S-transferase family protein [Sphingosinicella sp. GR2756]